jgi:histone acetyltransferase (RNA polymerase elongator complex component)
MKKNRILPVFIPFLGCNNQCIYCNQQAITGKKIASLYDDCNNQIKEYLNFSTNWDEIAFFGGSFTCMDSSYRKILYRLASENRFRNIRISTRPDCIDEEILEELLQNNVKTVELGIQSTSDRVLKQNGRSYTRKTVFATIGLLKDKFKTAAQFMVGMYGETAQDIFQIIEDIKQMPVDVARIYPLVVLKNSPLENIYRQNLFVPASPNNILARSAILYSYLNSFNIQVIRIGLPDSEHLKGSIIAGFYHPAMGDIVKTVVISAYIEKFGVIPFKISGFKKIIEIFYNKYPVSEVSFNKMINKVTEGKIEDNWRFFERASNIVSQKLYHQAYNG